MTDPRDDELRALLDDAVADVEPAHALHDIQNRTRKVTPMSSKRPWIYVAIGAVAATAATVVAVTVLSDDDTSPTSGPATSPSASASADESDDASPTPSPSPSPEPSETEPTPPPSGATAVVPVYYVGETPAGTRLYREFHQLEKNDVDAAQVRIALQEAVADSAVDPDYRSDWPSGTTVAGVNVDGPAADDVVWIDLADAAALRDRPAGMSQEQAEMAVEQLIHTAQAVLQQRHPIQFTLDGERTDMVLGVPVSEPLSEGDPMSVQATVWVITPQDGDTVGRTFTVEGRGAFFEANVSWQLLQGGEVVDEGFTTAEEGMTLSPYRFQVKAEPGDYVLRVYDADMSGGEGNGEAEDTKQITVK